MSSGQGFLQSSAVLVILDASGAVLGITPALPHSLEYTTPPDTLLDYIHPADQEIILERLRAATASTHISFCQCRTLMQGSYRRVEWTVLHFAGEPTIYAVGRDVETQAQFLDTSASTDEQLSLLASVLEQTKDAVIITTAWLPSAEPKIVFVNAAFTRIGGYSPDELIGKPVSIFRDVSYDVEANSRAREALLRGEVFTTEATFISRSGVTYVFDWHTVPLRAGGEQVAYYVSIFQDMTERKRHEQELEQQCVFNAALHETITAITSTLDLQTVMARILDNVGRVVPHDAANIMVLEGDETRVLYWRGYVEDEEGEPEIGFNFPEEENHILRRLRELEQPYVISSTQNDPNWLTSPLNHWVRSFVGVPIRSHDRTIGFLNLDSATENFFTQQDAARLAIFANYAAIAVENAQLYDAMRGYAAELAARVDERTGELKRAKEHVEAILTSTTDALVVTSVNGVIQRVNPAFSHLFGLSESEALERRLDAFAVDPVVLTAALDDLITSLRPRRVGLRMRNQNGVLFDADLMLSPLKDNVLYGIVCSLRDISAHKQMELSLRRALEREKELSVLKSRFISMASHEFRTPLATILSSSELLRRYKDRMSQEASTEHFDTIETGVRHMAQLIDDLLIIGKADEGRLQPSPVPLDLISFCRSLIEELIRSDLTAARIQFVHSADMLEAYADQSLIRQILTNLLSNALKYSPAHLPVRFTLERQGSDVIFTVTDQGIGIPEGDQPALFEAFHRGGNVGAIEGTGLGLAVLKRAVDLHRGHIKFESGENVGTTFEVCLPIAL